MAREKKQEEQKAGAPEWMNTFADMMTLLLCFFVLLFSMSQIDAEKWRAVVQVFSRDNSIFEKIDMSQATGDGHDLGSAGIEDESNDDYKDAATQWEIIGKNAEASLEDIQNSMGQQGALTMKQSENEIVIHVQGDILFDTGSDILRETAKPMIAEVMEEAVMPYLAALKDIRFEGHTDERPIGTQRFPSNKVLSACRAVSVSNFVDTLYPDVDRAIFSYMGYGEYRPLDPGHNMTAYDKNRRVDIVMVKQVFVDADGNTVTVAIPGLDAPLETASQEAAEASEAIEAPEPPETPSVPE